MTDHDRGRTVPEEAFALLGHQIRLDILSAFFDNYSPVDPGSRSEVRDQRKLSYSELMAATEMQDSGKFNYHLEKLRGVYVEKIDEEYVPTASAIALYQAVVANRPTESVSDSFDIEEACPNCGSEQSGRYEQEYFTIDCSACDQLSVYHFPKNGLTVRDGEDVYGAVYDRMMHHVGLARTGQCPSCAGKTSITVPRDRLDGESLPTAEMICETCSWLVTVDIVSALQFEPRITSALLEMGVPLGTSSSMQVTEQLLPSVTGRVRSDSPFRAVINMTHEETIARIVINDALNVYSIEVE